MGAGAGKGPNQKRKDPVCAAPACACKAHRAGLPQRRRDYRAALSQKDLTYIATPDLRTRYHPGQTLNCVLKEYDRREGQFWVSVKDTVDNPFLGALRRPPIGSRRQAVISGKYGGGVFCTLSDETVCLCHYSTLHSDLDFHVGDTVILAIKQFDYERSLIYGRILSKW